MNILLVIRAEQEVEQVRNHSGKLHTGNGCPLSMAVSLAKALTGILFWMLWRKQTKNVSGKSKDEKHIMTC